MGIPQIIVLGLMFCGLLLVAHKHGKKALPFNFWSQLITTSILLSLLWWGGFFAK